MGDKSINFKVDSEIYKRIKIKVAINEITIKDYVLSLIIKDLESKNNILRREE